jgi:hypothetical protein
VELAAVGGRTALKSKNHSYVSKLAINVRIDTTETELGKQRAEEAREKLERTC